MFLQQTQKFLAQDAYKPTNLEVPSLRNICLQIDPTVNLAAINLANHQ